MNKKVYIEPTTKMFTIKGRETLLEISNIYSSSPASDIEYRGEANDLDDPD